MSYPWIGLVGAVTGFVAGRFVIGSNQAIAIDVIVGAIAAWIAVVLSRVLAPVAAEGLLMSTIVSVAGASVMLFVMNRFMRSELMRSSRLRRRM